jgi:hypothetical protein
MRENELTKLEFMMKINDNIIVQRFFNVREFNNNAKNSVELYDLVSTFKNRLENQLRIKTATYMLDSMYEIMNNPNVMETSNTEGDESIKIFIKQGDRTIFHREIDAKVYPPKIRYTVDVRPLLKNFLLELTDLFSTENLTYEFGNVTLVA